MKILITGGAGFIGSALIKSILDNQKDSVLNVDSLTYAGNLQSLDGYHDSDNYNFAHVDICKQDRIDELFVSSHPGYRLLHDNIIIDEKRLPVFLDYISLVFQKFNFCTDWFNIFFV